MSNLTLLERIYVSYDDVMVYKIFENPPDPADYEKYVVLTPQDIANMENAVVKSRKMVKVDPATHTIRSIDNYVKQEETDYFIIHPECLCRMLRRAFSDFMTVEWDLSDWADAQYTLKDIEKKYGTQ